MLFKLKNSSICTVSNLLKLFPFLCWHLKVKCGVFILEMKFSFLYFNRNKEIDIKPRRAIQAIFDRFCKIEYFWNNEAELLNVNILYVVWNCRKTGLSVCPRTLADRCLQNMIINALFQLKEYINAYCICSINNMRYIVYTLYIEHHWWNFGYSIAHSSRLVHLEILEIGCKTLKSSEMRWIIYTLKKNKYHTDS